MLYDEEGLYGWILNAAALDSDSVPTTPWILATGSWDDAAFWVDTDVWNDGGVPLVSGFSEGFNTGFGA